MPRYAIPILIELTASSEREAWAIADEATAWVGLQTIEANSQIVITVPRDKTLIIQVHQKTKPEED